MSVYFVKGKGWRYDFILQGSQVLQSTWFETKTEAKKAEAKKREEIQKPRTERGDPNRHGLLGASK